MATISDIAKATGMARTTVAEVLRGKPGYSQQARERILSAAEQLGYRPNYLSKALSGGKSMTVGIVVPSLDTPITNERLSAAEVAARRHGYLAYVTSWSGDKTGASVRYIEDLLQRRVDGLILHYEGRFPSGLATLLAKSKVPRVLFENAPPGIRSVVLVEREPAAAALAAHLRELGHRRVALMLSAYHHAHPSLRLDIFRRAFERVGIEVEPPEKWRPPKDHSSTSIGAYQLLRARLDAGATLPTALVANSDLWAQGLLAALHDAGLRVPEDVSVVGFDDLPIATTTIPPLTTIRQPRGELGEAAFEMLQRLMQNPADDVEPVCFPCELVVRRSTGPAGGGDRCIS
ncbi:MAG: LacI family DNA-binding transcriptional regulator [bacterium]